MEEKIPIPFDLDHYQEQQSAYFQYQLARSLATGGWNHKTPNEVDDEGYSLLYRAVLAQNEALVRSLLQSGADPNLRMYERTVLHNAAQYGTTENILRLLAAAGADFNAGNDYKVTPFQMLSPSTKPEIIRLWVELGSSIEPSRDRYTLLHSWANSGGSVDGLQTLLDLGLPLDSPDRDFGATPLAWAIYNNDHLDLIPFLLDKGANMNGKDKKGEPYFFSLAREYPEYPGSQELHLAKLKLLLERGLEINATDQDGRTFLMTALRWACTTGLVETFLQKNPRLDAKDSAGKTALDYLQVNNKLGANHKQSLQIRLT